MAARLEERVALDALPVTHGFSHSIKCRDSQEPMTRSENMSRIRSRDTFPEIALRKELHRRGFRYRCCVSRLPRFARRLPGTPDIVFVKEKIAVLVHGCFWHQHEACRDASKPKTNSDYWAAKFRRNSERDVRQQKELCDLGFVVIIVWGCEVSSTLNDVANRIAHRVAVRRAELANGCSQIS